MERPPMSPSATADAVDDIPWSVAYGTRCTERVWNETCATNWMTSTTMKVLFRNRPRRDSG
jgi:hypothetical protein